MKPHGAWKECRRCVSGLSPESEDGIPVRCVGCENGSHLEKRRYHPIERRCPKCNNGTYLDWRADTGKKCPGCGWTRTEVVSE